MESLLPFLLDFEEEIARSKDIKRAKAFWIKLAWEVETCAEAKELFPDMTICPVCLNHALEGRILHKLSFDIVN